MSAPSATARGRCRNSWGEMKKYQKTIVVVGLIVLGVAMLVIGGIARLVPPAITGAGFLLIAWAESSR
jgi:NhaP-type Na+/H+ or K+/H+ antiporter